MLGIGRDGMKQKIWECSVIYRVILIGALAGISIGLLCCITERSSEILYLFYFSCCVFIAIMTFLAIYGELKEKLLLQLVSLVVQFFFSFSLIFFELFAILNAIYFFFCLEYGQDSIIQAHYVGQFRGSFMFSVIFGVFAPLNFYFAFYVPLRCFLRKLPELLLNLDKKKDENLSTLA